MIKYFKSAHRTAAIAVDYDKKQYVYVEAHRDCAIIDGSAPVSESEFNDFIENLIVDEPRRTELPTGGYSVDSNYYIECDQNEFLSCYHGATAHFSSFGIYDDKKAEDVEKEQWWVLRDDPEYGLSHIINNCPFPDIVAKAKIELAEIEVEIQMHSGRT